MGKGKRPVHKIAEDVRQLVVVLRLKIPPGEVGIPVFRQCSGQIVAERIGREFIQEVLHVDPPAPALGEFLSFEVEKLVRRNILRKNELLFPAVVPGHEHRGENDGMENDIVLPDKRNVLCGRVEPVLLPGVGPPLAEGPFLG